ncbi:MAG: HD domain-containing protein, partial [Clostridiaceae bacterium]|nr:HD domain-containing protein [Clostridiaceae bacterium]
QRQLLSILATAEKLKDVMRHSYTSGGRQESVAEHSWRLALMAMLLKDEFSDIDINKVIKMCLIHDIGEAFTGDIPAFIKTAEDRQYESSVVTAWIDTLPEGLQSTMLELFDEMDTLDTDEAKLFKSLDKLEALIQHNEANISTWLDLEYALQIEYANKECSFHPYIKELRALVKKDTINKIGENTSGKENQ